MSLPLELDGVAEKKARSLARSSLDYLGVGDLIDRFPSEVSRGQAQRAAIASAFIAKDRILVADEPTGALDSQAAKEVLRLMRARVDAGSTGILVTHEARFAAWTDDVVLLRDGVIVSRGERS